MKTVEEFNEAINTSLYGGETIVDCNGQEFVYTPIVWPDDVACLYQSASDRWIKPKELQYPVYLLK